MILLSLFLFILAGLFLVILFAIFLAAILITMSLVVVFTAILLTLICMIAVLLFMLPVLFKPVALVHDSRCARIWILRRQFRNFLLHLLLLEPVLQELLWLGIADRDVLEDMMPHFQWDIHEEERLIIARHGCGMGLQSWRLWLWCDGVMSACATKISSE